MIRLAEPADLPHLPEIDVAAGSAFRDVGMDAIADDDPPPLALFETHFAEGRLWVWAEHAQRPVAFCLVDVVDGNAHIEQISVHPSHARRAIGAALIDHLDEWARDRGLPELTLTTFVDVPWNGPYYRRLGFTAIADDDLGPGLRAVLDAESERGLDRWPRIAMTRHVPIDPGPTTPSSARSS
ncbi:GNAT family N-acetyltransferase [Rhodococcus sp. TAF43]|jgi:GNAT superfamily N-acetyltransferase|uniref:GNAT family N-acetyltransferase n=1 Tax=unclassified Rhodococcus (in: high G+C Gram-positive bacteria) TaxID=192944 RepID=UPI001583C4F4|nr:GNAT family N-acetyltransferase [Rhodococcus sp. W8901]QKT12918.1 GNAT family N-acetyltransferase [Rhodococcus sp. W8901]